jgi:hypothetical protein
MNNFVDFCSYFNNDNNRSMRFDELGAFKDYYAAYSSYLVARKYDLEDIKRFRMNSVIDYFMQINMLNDTYRDELRRYYIKYVQDDFNRTLNPPRCPFYLEEKYAEEQQKLKEYEDETDEVKQHYRELDAKYKYFAELNHKLTCHDEDDDNMSSSESYQEYHDYASTSSEAYDNYYDEYSYDDYDNNDAYDNDNYDDDEYDDDYY